MDLDDYVVDSDKRKHGPTKGSYISYSRMCVMSLSENRGPQILHFITFLQSKIAACRIYHPFVGTEKRIEKVHENPMYCYLHDLNHNLLKSAA